MSGENRADDTLVAVGSRDDQSRGAVVDDGDHRPLGRDHLQGLVDRDLRDGRHVEHRPERPREAVQQRDLLVPPEQLDGHALQLQLQVLASAEHLRQQARRPARRRLLVGAHRPDRLGAHDDGRRRRPRQAVAGGGDLVAVTVVHGQRVTDRFGERRQQLGNLGRIERRQGSS